MLYVVILSVVMLNVIIQSVVVPYFKPSLIRYWVISALHAKVTLVKQYFYGKTLQLIFFGVSMMKKKVLSH
jgi:hypothetical protein